MSPLNHDPQAIEEPPRKRATRGLKTGDGAARTTKTLISSQSQNLPVPRGRAHPPLRSVLCLLTVARMKSFAFSFRLGTDIFAVASFCYDSGPRCRGWL